MTFRVGQKVVCVNVQGNRDVKLGTVYTISRIWAERFPTSGEAGVWLHEVAQDFDHPFYASRFRPVVERKTDITVFTKILRKATKPAPATPVALHHLGTEP